MLYSSFMLPALLVEKIGSLFEKLKVFTRCYSPPFPEIIKLKTAKAWSVTARIGFSSSYLTSRLLEGRRSSPVAKASCT